MAGPEELEQLHRPEEAVQEGPQVEALGMLPAPPGGVVDNMPPLPPSLG